VKRAIFNYERQNKEVKEMAKEKQYVFSARTTEEGLKALGEVKARLTIGWGELVIEAVSAHYELDRAVMTLPKKEAPIKEIPAQQESPTETVNETSQIEEVTKGRSATLIEEESPKKHGKGKKKGTH
jgi:hypothetical protein